MPSTNRKRHQRQHQPDRAEARRRPEQHVPVGAFGEERDGGAPPKLGDALVRAVAEPSRRADIEIAGQTIRAGEGLILANDSRTRTRRSSPSPTASTCPATRTGGWRSGSACTSASASRRPGSSCRSPGDAVPNPPPRSTVDDAGPCRTGGLGWAVARTDSGGSGGWAAKGIPGGVRPS
ncbi:hypothetical protein GCM10017788_03780 [Amycolatopsis acidiphila]|nr:hypothetical protein GCM10017788_03780 [Amycolatopsis acidiphila]